METLPVFLAAGSLIAAASLGLSLKSKCKSYDANDAKTVKSMETALWVFVGVGVFFLLVALYRFFRPTAVVSEI